MDEFTTALRTLAGHSPDGVVVGMLAYDRGRLESLRLAVGEALDDLHGIRCDDAAAAEAMMAVSGACRTLDELCLPRIQDILSSDPLSSYHRARVDGNDVGYAWLYAASNTPGWNVVADPLAGSTAVLTVEEHQHRRDELTDSSTARTDPVRSGANDRYTQLVAQVAGALPIVSWKALKDGGYQFTMSGSAQTAGAVSPRGLPAEQPMLDALNERAAALGDDSNLRFFKQGGTKGADVWGVKFNSADDPEPYGVAIHGEIYAPTTDKVRNIVDEIARKAGQQKPNMFVDLSNTDVKAADVLEGLESKRGLEWFEQKSVTFYDEGTGGFVSNEQGGISFGNMIAESGSASSEPYFGTPSVTYGAGGAFGGAPIGNQEEEP